MSVCPCQILENFPCKDSCTCHNPVMSGGCSRCCTYGSKEQQIQSAIFIRDAICEAEAFAYHMNKED